MSRPGGRGGLHGALRRWQRAHPELPAPGCAGDPRQEAVRIRQVAHARFEPRQVLATAAPGERRATLQLSAPGILSARGPLPSSWLASGATGAGATTLAAFLQHRLLLLLHRAWSQAALPIDGSGSPPGLRPMVAALCGGRVPERAAEVLHLSRRCPTAAGLQWLLRSRLGAPVRVIPAPPRWQRLDSDQLWRLGRATSGRLGEGALLGRAVLCRAPGFRVRVGPVDSGLLSALESKRCGFWRRLAACVGQYAGACLRWDAEVFGARPPPLRLGRGLRLGAATALGSGSRARSITLRFEPGDAPVRVIPHPSPTLRTSSPSDPPARPRADGGASRRARAGSDCGAGSGPCGDAAAATRDDGGPAGPRGTVGGRGGAVRSSGAVGRRGERTSHHHPEAAS